MTPSAASATERAGEVLAGKYRIVRLIGEGGMGRVYEAEHVTVGRRFAVKLLRSNLAASDEAVARFRREARAAGALENEHIAAVVDFDVAADGAPFLVMEYLEGRNLGQLLADEGPLPVPRALNALLQVCRGLEAAHAAGIVHRDLKPDNLFVTRRADGSELIKILDFGIAKLQNLSPELPPINTLNAIGTPFYMAPEQARGEKNLDERVDVYAAGVILFELLSGEKPHPGDCGNAVLAHVLTQSAVRLETLRPGLPPALVELVHRALAFSPLERPPSARALSRELESFLPPEVRRGDAQFDLRAAPLGPGPATLRGTAPTLPTPDSHALSVPARATRSSRRPWFLLSALLAPLFGFLLFRWFDSRNGTSADAAAEQPSAAAPAPSPATPSTATATLPEPSAEPTVEVPPGRPRGRPPATRRPERAAAAMPDENPVDLISPKIAASGSAAPRVRFDAQNPYD